MKTNNTIINSIMKNYIKYLCAVLMVLGMSINAWGATDTKTYDGTDLSDWSGSHSGQYADGSLKLDAQGENAYNYSIWSGAISSGMTSITVTINYKINGSGSSSNVFTVAAVNSSGTVKASQTFAPTSTSYTDAEVTLTIPASSAVTGLKITYTTKSSGNVGVASLEAVATYTDATYNVYLMSGCTGNVAGSYSCNKGTSGSGTGAYSSCIKYSGITAGTSVTITATPADGYQFNGWTNGGYSIIFDDSYNEITPSSTTSTTATFTMPSSDVVIWECNFSESCISRTITVNTGTPRNYGSGTFTPTLSSAQSTSGTKSSWSSSNTSVATINSSTGLVTIVGAGSTTISVDVAASGDYCAATASGTLVVNAVAPTVTNFTASCTNNKITITNANASTVSNKGGKAITRYGYLYSTSVSTPTFGASGVSDASVGTSDVTLNARWAEKEITGLSAGTTYYVRAYAYNGSEYGYSSVVTVTTKCAVTYAGNGGTGTVTDASSPYAKLSDVTVLANGFTPPFGKKFVDWLGSDANHYEPGDVIEDISTDITLTAQWTDITYADYVFSCVDISVASAAAGKALITSRYEADKNINIMAANPIKVTISGAVSGHRVTFTNSVGLHFYKKVEGTGGDAGKYKYVEATGANSFVTPLTNQEVYVSYKPTSAGTGAILSNLPFTISCDGESQEFNTGGEYVKARNLPGAVAIAAKIGGTWHALSADITSSTTPKDISIYTSTVDGVLTAYGDVTELGYKLWPVLTVNSTNDRWGNASSYYPAKLFGDRLRFAGKSDKGLWANNNNDESSSKYHINNYAVIDAIDDDPAAPYEWKVTTTEVDEQFVYTLQTDQTLNTKYLRLYNGRWGTYLDGKGVNELYILPLVSANLVEMNAYEWGENEVAVTYTPSVTPDKVDLTSVTIGNDDPINKGTASLENVGGDIWKISGLSDLTTKSAQQFVVRLTENGAAKQALMQVPFIVASAKTEQNLRQSVSYDSKIYGNVDVVIRNGGKLTTGSNSGSFANLLIYPGGQAVVSHNMSFNNIYMRGGYSVLDNKATYRYPDLCVKEGTITTEGLTYDMFIDNRYYYTFSMPYNVTLASVTDEAGNEDFPVWVKHYNGATRASGTHVSGWEWYGDNPVTQHSFFAGVGYEITAKPKVSGRPLAIIRFPVKTGNITSDASREIGVSVGNYGYDDYESGSLAANNVGWNFVGNPYLTEYKAGTASPANDTLMIVAQGYVQHIDPTTGVWDGTYDWQASNKRFITVPYDTQSDYHSEYVATYAIPAFSAFFIQTEAEGTFYMRGTRPQAAGVAPRYMQTQREKPEMHLDVLLRGDNEAVEAKAGLIIHDKYEGGLKDFEDVEQWFVDQNEQKTYTFANGTALAYNLLNEQAAAQVIPMGYIATVAGEHVYSISESNDVSRLAQLLLTDYETGLTTDLLVHDYVFTTEAGRFDERFAISAVLEKDEVVTEVAGTSSDSWTKTIGVYRDGNTLTLRGLPEGSSAYLYDMTGKLIASGQHLHNVASFNIAAQGVYNIRVVSGDEAVTLRSVLQ